MDDPFVLTAVMRDQLRLLDRIGAAKNSPAFWIDFGEIKPRQINALELLGFAGRARLVHYGGRREIGYWITPAGRSALQSHTGGGS